MIDLGYMIRKRYELNLKQIEVGELIHASKNTVSRWESGLAEPNISRFKQWCNAIGADPNEAIKWE